MNLPQGNKFPNNMDIKKIILAAAFLGWSVTEVRALEATAVKPCIVGQPDSCPTPKATALSVSEPEPLTQPIYCNQIICAKEEYCYFDQQKKTGECRPIKDDYCGGGGLENVYPVKPCPQPEYTCLPILLGSKQDLPKVCLKAFMGETSGKVKIAAIPIEMGENSQYRIETEGAAVVSKIKVESDGQEIKAGEKIIINPEIIKKTAGGEVRQIYLENYCSGQDCKPAYQLETVNAYRLLGIIPVKLTVKQTVDAVSGQPLAEFRPWFIKALPFLFK